MINFNFTILAHDKNEKDLYLKFWPKSIKPFAKLYKT